VRATASLDGANAFQTMWYITLPLLRNVFVFLSVTGVTISLQEFLLPLIMTAGGPRNMTHMFATYAFKLGIESGDIPLGSSVSLFMFPILAISAVFILRGVRKRGREIG